MVNELSHLVTSNVQYSRSSFIHTVYETDFNELRKYFTLLLKISHSKFTKLQKVRLIRKVELRCSVSGDRDRKTLSRDRNVKS
jgi:hypothetical protein